MKLLKLVADNTIIDFMHWRTLPIPDIRMFEGVNYSHENTVRRSQSEGVCPSWNRATRSIACSCALVNGSVELK